MPAEAKSFLASLIEFIDKPMKLYCGNQVALDIAKNLVFYKRTKHITMNYYFVRECLFSKDLTTAYLPSKYQFADIFTKNIGQATISVFMM